MPAMKLLENEISDLEIKFSGLGETSLTNATLNFMTELRFTAQHTSVEIKVEVDRLRASAEWSDLIRVAKLLRLQSRYLKLISRATKTISQLARLRFVDRRDRAALALRNDNRRTF